MIQLSIIIPVLNEAKTIVANLHALQKATSSVSAEIIVVDGGSDDGTADLSRPYVDKVISAPKGRASQMNAGAKQAVGDVLLFLHGDTLLPDDDSLVLLPSSDWGFFRIRLSGGHIAFRMIEHMINIRSQLTRVATGDQCLFVKKKRFTQLNGFATIPLMEDVELCKRLRVNTKPMVISSPVISSSRRWEEKGIVRTVMLMWYLRALYFLGVSPSVLLKKYYV
jgi:rSAM/selenodomain-associated transferase 2